MIARILVKLSVSAVVATMLLRLLALYAVLTEKSVVPDVEVKRGALERVIPVGSIAVPNCNGCKNEREGKGHSPRKLHRLPVEVTQDKSFKRKGLPVELCPFCDGDAIELALSTHEKRSSSS